jgi:serine protease Do
MNDIGPIRLLCAVTLLCLAPLQPRAAALPSLDLAHQLNQAFVEVVEKVSPSVVVITVTEKPSPSREFGRRSRHRFEDSPEETGQASGIIIRADGYILTNGHVVENADDIEVRLKDGRTFKAKVRGVDPRSDVAVIKIEARGLPAARLADSAKTRVGEFAIAIGAPFELDYSVTFGHVSAKGRSNVMPSFLSGGMIDQDFIQTDANINPGNSGGPLVNIDGEVVGMNTLIEGLHTGIGFAIPSNLAREIADQLIAEGKFRRAWLGVSIGGLREYAEYRERVKGISDGVYVDRILPNGPAAKSDLRTNDVITAVDGKRVTTTQELRNEVRSKAIGQPVMLEVFRNGQRLQVKVRPTEWVEERATFATRENASPDNPSVNLGLTVQALTPALAEQFGVGMVAGVIVTAVEKDSPAARRNIMPGDIITAINHQSVANVREFRSVSRQADLKKGVLVNLISSNKTRFEILKEAGE